MSWPRIALYYLLAIGIGLYLQGEIRRLHPLAAVPVATTLPFVEAVAERVDRLRAEREDLSVEFRKREGRWVVTEPEGVTSPSDIVDAVLESLTSLPPIEVVADNSEHGQYGLNPPRIRVRIEAGGEILSTIAFGELNPTRTAVYAKKSGKEEIYLLGLNSRYYLDLVFENVRRQMASAGVTVAPPAGVEEVTEPAPAIETAPAPKPTAPARKPASGSKRK